MLSVNSCPWQSSQRRRRRVMAVRGHLVRIQVKIPRMTLRKQGKHKSVYYDWH